MITDSNEELILIDGVSSGIGLCTAKILLEKGKKVVGLARNCEKVSHLLTSFNNQFFFEEIDLSANLDLISDFIDMLACKYGKFSGFVHSAGVLNPAPLKIWNYENAIKDFNVNIFSAVEIIKALRKKNIRQSFLNIVLVSSIAANNGNPGSITYAMSKAAIDNLVISLTKEIGKEKIRINSVRPGWTDTDLVKKYNKIIDKNFLQEASLHTPFKEFGKPEYIANVITFLLSNLSYWIQGQNITVDGAETLGSI